MLSLQITKGTLRKGIEIKYQNLVNCLDLQSCRIEIVLNSGSDTQDFNIFFVCGIAERQGYRQVFCLDKRIYLLKSMELGFSNFTCCLMNQLLDAGF